ncbi:MAG TPA: hypothetical protein VFZ98_12695 [Vicinamibacterales bacterium]
MKTTLVIAAMLAGASAAYAQDTPPAAQAPAQTATAPAPGPVKPTPPSPERLREVKVMESILANAVGQGASDLARQMQVTDPGSIVSINQARARGIALDGYGVLFDVDVPLMNLSVVWTRGQMLQMKLRDEITNAKRVQAHTTSTEDRDRLEAEIQMLTRQLVGLSPPPPLSADSSGSATPVAESTQPPAAGSVVAQTVDVTPAPALDMRGTDEMYTDAIKKALIDAMVNHSSALMLTDDEWLTVAARDNAGPTIPGTIDDRSGIILRIKGSDLAAFRANKLSRVEVTKKVEILEWR